MESVSTFFKIEKDIFYQVGEKHGMEKGKAITVKKLLLANRFTVAEIADFADVTEDFVEKIKKSLKG